MRKMIHIKKFNENISNVSESKITFYANKSWEKPNLISKRLYRNSFNVDKIENDVVYLYNLLFNHK